jgi:hypothetical protein
MDEPVKPVVSSIEPEEQKVAVKEEKKHKEHNSAKSLIERASKAAAATAPDGLADEDDLDIPAFIRRKVD